MKLNKEFVLNIFSLRSVDHNFVYTACPKLLSLLLDIWTVFARTQRQREIQSASATPTVNEDQPKHSTIPKNDNNLPSGYITAATSSKAGSSNNFKRWIKGHALDCGTPLRKCWRTHWVKECQTIPEYVSGKANASIMKSMLWWRYLEKVLSWT